MISQYLDNIKSRKNFYRDYYHKALILLIIVLILIGLLTMGVIYIVFTEPPMDYYASNHAGGLMKLTPLNAPNMSEKPLIN